MPKLLCKIIDSFSIEGRGTVIALESMYEWRIPRSEPVHRREVIRILRPDQSSTTTFIKDFDFIRHAGGRESLAFTLPRNVGVEDAPADSMIFLEREDDVPIFWDGVPPRITKAEQGGGGQAATRSEST
ncbi:hypothetical protein [Haloferula sp. A504]|uniref:hypothetical protein n=1 Tax=Haloferula sp. A504 TaxID=3373601 RepID=UPI0031CBA1DB|nr:hypothetical protein [Verrucomicrobiaceae bacterium E54]